MPKPIEAKITEIKDSKVCLEIERQKLALNSEFLPEKISRGAKLQLYFLNPETAITSEKKLAKMVLEEILNGK